MRCRSLLVVPVLTTLALACTEAPPTDVDEGALTAGSSLDVDDVSILFPLRGATTAYPDLAAVGPTTAFDRASFDAVVSAVTTQQSATVPTTVVKDGVPVAAPGPAMSFAFRELAGASAPDRWRVVAMRFDSCAPAPIEVNGVRPCLVQIRLIAQPLRDTRAQDMAMHLVYTLGGRDGAVGPLPAYGPDKLKQAVEGLVAIKTASIAAGGPTNGAPLDVHPGLLAEGKGTQTAVGDAVKGFIEARIKEKLAFSVAAVGLRESKVATGTNSGQNAPDFWVFAAGSLAPATTPGGSPTFRLAPIDVFTTPLSQTPTFSEGFDIRTRSFSGDRGPIRPSHQPNTAQYLTSQPFSRAFKDAFTIDDAAQTHFFKQDCIGCHTATRQIMVIRRSDSNQTDGDNLKFVHRPAPGVTTWVRCQNMPGTGMSNCNRVSGQTNLEAQWNFRSFGYFHEKPTITLRTANETEAVVVDLNKRVLGANKGPGPDCSAAAEAVWKCFADLRDGASGRECLQRFCQ